jgi:glutamate-1-semialdehyde 2,1-aminomutase
LPYNDIAALGDLFAARGQEIAAVIVEPVAGNMGCVPPGPGFLRAIVDQCARHGALSIFDEVMTGFRLARGGAQELFGLSADLTCLGKVIGGGLPLAAYGGRDDVMKVLAPLGPVYQAGTLSGNPLAISAGLATIALLTYDVYDSIEARAGALEQGLVRAIRDRKASACVQRVGSMLTLFFGEGPIRSWTDARGCDVERFATWHRGLLARGVYWPPSQFEAAFVSAAHTDDDIDMTVEAAAQAMDEALR